MNQHRPLIGVYPGTFDPITFGHMDIISRATRVVDHLIVAVAHNAGKGPLFSIDERVQMVREELNAIETNNAEVEVRSFRNLLIHFTQEVGARVIIRGLRAVSAFEYEFQMASMNARLNSDVETVFLTASGSRRAFIEAIWNSYSKSETARSPRIITLAPTSCVKCISRLRKERTSTSALLVSITPSSSRTIWTRSSIENKGPFPALCATATIRWSTTRVAREMMSMCPKVIGSKVPG